MTVTSAFLSHHSMGWGWAALSIVALVLLAVLAVGVIVGLFRDRDRPSPRELLDRRLASGELTIEDYDRALNTMKLGQSEGAAGAPPPAPA